MTPKEKAQELFNSMSKTHLIILHNKKGIPHNPYKNGYFSVIIRKHRAKQCALIAVDEILNIDYFDMTENYFNDHIEYWQEVKEELNKL